MKLGIAEFQPMLAKWEMGITAFVFAMIDSASVATVVAMAMDASCRVVFEGSDVILGDLLDGDNGKALMEHLGITQITKEQFYDLTT